MQGNISAMQLRRIASLPSGGTGSGTGGSSGPSATDIASTVLKLLPGLVSFFKGIFGDYTYTTGVRWLTQQYQYYVLGQANATGTHTGSGVDEKYTPEAQTWFSAVLGVPIFDRERLHALMGTRVSDGAPLNNTDAARVDSYLRPTWTDTQGVPREKVMRAVQIAKQFRWGAMPGTWAQFGVPADPPQSAGGAGGGLIPGISGDKMPLYLGGTLLLIWLYLYYDGDS